MAFHFSPNIVTNGLVLYWDSANLRSYSGTGSVWTDLINSYSGVSTNFPNFSNSNGSSFDFDGSSNYVSTNYSDSFGTSNLTFNIWMSYTASQQGGVLSKRIGVSSEQLSVFITGDSLGTSAGTKILIYDYSSPDSRNIFTSESYNDGFWHYISYVRDTSQSSLYIDGRFISSTVSTKPNLSNLSNLFIGVAGDGSNLSGLYFMGKISTVQLYNRALSSFEVLQNYETIKTRFDS